MALKPDDKKHADQIRAGTTGRDRGHEFERELARALNEFDLGLVEVGGDALPHLVVGYPPLELVRYVCRSLGIDRPTSLHAWWVGGLATAGAGDELTDSEGRRVMKCKSDVVLEIGWNELRHVIGVSVKTCSKATPTNDQLYFSTARAFCRLLREHGVPVSEAAEDGLRRFCGDAGFRPADVGLGPPARVSDPDRWFWEELPAAAREEWKTLLSERQQEVTRVLLQKAYSADPFPPEFVLHQRVAFDDFTQCPMALFSVDELIAYSCRYRAFWTRPYRVRKGRFKGDPNEHLAPRFGYVQFQRGGQKQHPTQLQFNLEAGYFSKLPTE